MNNNSNVAEQNDTSANKQQEKQTPKQLFGDGRYSNVMKELYHDSQSMLGISEGQALKLAKTFGSDLGRFASKAESIKISKPNKDMQVTLREASKIKGITLTNALTLAKLVAGLQELKVYGVEQYNITLEAGLVEWLNKKD